MILALEEYLRALPKEAEERPESSERVAARSVLALAAARLCWSASLGRKVAYLPDELLRRSLGPSVAAIRAHYGADVLVAPDSVEFR